MIKTLDVKSFVVAVDQHPENQSEDVKEEEKPYCSHSPITLQNEENESKGLDVVSDPRSLLQTDLYLSDSENDGESFCSSPQPSDEPKIERDDSTSSAETKSKFNLVLRNHC